jgi:peptide subunit release factor RF-3
MRDLCMFDCNEVVVGSLQIEVVDARMAAELSLFGVLKVG